MCTMSTFTYAIFACHVALLAGLLEKHFLETHSLHSNSRRNTWLKQNASIQLICILSKTGKQHRTKLCQGGTNIKAGAQKKVLVYEPILPECSANVNVASSCMLGRYNNIHCKPRSCHCEASLWAEAELMIPSQSILNKGR